MGGFDVHFQIPSNLIAVGPTSCGKTTWLKKLVKYRHDLFSLAPMKMILFYKQSQKDYHEMERLMNQNQNENCFVKYDALPSSVEDMKELLDQFPKSTPKLIVFDDYLDEVGSMLKHFFTVLTHHYNCFTIFLCQNLFSAKSDLRTLSINSQYITLFNNPRDQSSVLHLAKQVFPGNIHTLTNAYKAATNEKPYGYLLLDFHQKQHALVRLRSHIFPDEYPMRAYNIPI